MIKKTLLIIACICTTISTIAQTNQDRCNQGNSLLKVVTKYHYQPKDINEQFTRSVIRDIMQTLDPHAVYFLKDDTTKLLIEQDKLKEYLQNTSCSYLNLVSDLFKTRLLEADTIISQILSTPLKLMENDSISFDDYSNLKFSSNSISLKAKWEKRLKFEILNLLFNQVASDSLIFNEKDEEKLSRVPEITVKVKAREKNSIKKILNKPEGYDNYVCSVILNAVAQNFDPHTSFFSKTDKENFDNSLSKESSSFGFEIKINQNGDFLVDKIKPGSPAWKSNKLQIGDYLIEASAQGRAALDFTNTDFYEASSFMQSSDVKTIVLKVKHSNGKIESIQLTKEKLAVEQNQIHSFILKGSKKIGYIALPDFYVGEDQRLLGCSNDVAKEIIKLLKEKIEGLIIDIRFNGGGDMNEANELTGLFIDEGPVSIIADRFS
ncbi:MAG TPA: hypothetical protein DIW31_11070, partial [Bacteroidales bacterium]|nr:hypothetical protein [Bacteroidales bacterium]